MKLGFCTMGYLDYTTLEEAVRRIGRAGYEAVDFWAYSPHLGPDLYPGKKEREAVKRLVADCGLTTAALSINGGGLALHHNFSHSVAYVRDFTVRHYFDCIALARDIGCPMTNMISGHMVYGTSREQAWEWNRTCMTAVVRRAKDEGLTVVLHTLTPSESRVMVTLDDALQMMREIGEPNLKVMIDTADQNVTDPNLSDAVRKAGKDLAYVHTNDNSGIGQGDVHLPPGRGSIDWRMFFRALKEIGYDGTVTAQVHTGHPVDIDSWLYQTHDYLDRVMREAGVRP
jgi:protein FrlC